MKSPQIITTTEQLEHLAVHLVQCSVIGVDTESDSAFAYYEKVCLVQLSTADADYIIDSLAIADLAPLGAIFAADNVEKIFHDGHYDLMCLKRDYDFEFANLFDTMWGGRVLGWRYEGLSNLLQEHFAVKTDKRYQRYNWGKRPLAPKAVHYAQLDTHYLIPLRDMQKRELEARGKMAEAQEIFAEVAATLASEHRDYRDAAGWQISGTRNMKPRSRAILHHLVCWREREAARRDRPPFMIFNNRTLIKIAKRAPSKLQELECIRGIKEYHLRRYGGALLRAVKRGLNGRAPKPPRERKSSRETRSRYQRLVAWRKDMARRRGVHSTVVMSKDTLWTIAKRKPRTREQLGEITGIGEWRLQKYGAEILEVVRET